MTFEQFKQKLNKYNIQIQNAIESDSGTNFVQVLSSPDERKFNCGAHFLTKRFEGKGENSRTYKVAYYVTFSCTKFDGKNYMTIRRDLPAGKDLRILFITDKGWSTTTFDYIMKNGYAFKGSKRFENLLAIDFEKLTFNYHLNKPTKVMWDAKFLAHFNYGDTQFRGKFKVEFFKDKALTDKINYEAEAGSAKSLYEKLIHECNFDMKMSTFFYHTSKCDNNGVKIIRYKGARGVLFIKLTIEGRKPNKNHRITEDEFEEEILTLVPDEIYKEAKSFDNLADFETYLFWKYHIIVKENYAVRFKFKKE